MDASTSTLTGNNRQGALKSTSKPQETLTEKLRWPAPNGKWYIYFVDETGSHDRELTFEGRTAWCLSADKSCQIPVLELPDQSDNWHEAQFVLRQAAFNLSIVDDSKVDQSVPEYIFGGESVMPEPSLKKARVKAQKPAVDKKVQKADAPSTDQPQADILTPSDYEQLYLYELEKTGAKVISLGKHGKSVTAEVVVRANGQSHTFHVERYNGYWHHRLGVFEASQIPLLCELRRVRRVEPEMVDDHSPTESDVDRAEAMRNQRKESMKRRKAGRRLVAQLENLALSAKLMAAEDAIQRRREAEDLVRTRAEAKGTTIQSHIVRQVVQAQKERAITEDTKLAAESRRPTSRTADEHDQQRERWNRANRPTERANEINGNRASRDNQNRRRV